MRRSGRERPFGPCAARGSSRRAPERAGQAGNAANAVRFIPACAGAGRPRRALSMISGSSRRAPERGGPRGGTPAPQGSSRRAPERAMGERLRKVGVGFIPACAGAGPRETLDPAIQRVHPGVRRSGRCLSMMSERTKGSSRRAPERGPPRRRHARPAGFIPACAGAGSRA